METNTASPAMLHVFFVQNYDEPDNDVEHIGIFPSLNEAIKFRTQWICDNFDVNDPNLEEEWMMDFSETFGGSPRDPWLDNGHSFFVIQEVVSFV